MLFLILKSLNYLPSSLFPLPSSLFFNPILSTPFSL